MLKASEMIKENGEYRKKKKKLTIPRILMNLKHIKNVFVSDEADEIYVPK